MTEPGSGATPRRRRGVPTLLAITDLRTLRRPVTEWLDELVDAGVDAVQIREKHLDDRASFELARTVAEHVGERLTVLVNGRVDVALAAGCHGVHLPADSVPVAAIRARFGPSLLIGRSTHNLDEVRRASEGGADYVTFGPVYPTSSKEAYGPPPGLAGLESAVSQSPAVLALGGVEPSRLGDVRAAGARGVAGIRAFQDAGSLVEMALAGRRLWPIEERTA